MIQFTAVDEKPMAVITSIFDLSHQSIIDVVDMQRQKVETIMGVAIAVAYCYFNTFQWKIVFSFSKFTCVISSYNFIYFRKNNNTF